MIQFVAKIADVAQKFKLDNEGNRKTVVTVKYEVKEGHESVPELAEMLGEAVTVTAEPVQPGLVD